MTDTARLEAIIRESGLKKSYIAKVLGIAPETLTRKIKNVCEFKGLEIDALCKTLGIDSPEERCSIFFVGE